MGCSLMFRRSMWKDYMNDCALSHYMRGKHKDYATNFQTERRVYYRGSTILQTALFCTSQTVNHFRNRLYGGMNITITDLLTKIRTFLTVLMLTQQSYFLSHRSQDLTENRTPCFVIEKTYLSNHTHSSKQVSESFSFSFYL